MTTRTATEREPDPPEAHAQDWAEELLANFRQELAQRVELLESQGADIDAIGAPADIASEMLDTFLPVRWSLDERVGPFLTSRAVQRRLGVSRQRVHARTKAKQILAVRTSDGHTLYPEFQFRGARLVEGFSQVLRDLNDSADAWMLTTWFTTPEAELEGRSPIEALQAGQVERVRILARDMAGRWAQ